MHEIGQGELHVMLRQHIVNLIEYYDNNRQGKKPVLDLSERKMSNIDLASLYLGLEEDEELNGEPDYKFEGFGFVLPFVNACNTEFNNVSFDSLDLFEWDFSQSTLIDCDLRNISQMHQSKLDEVILIRPKLTIDEEFDFLGLDKAASIQDPKFFDAGDRSVHGVKLDEDTHLIYVPSFSDRFNNWLSSAYVTETLAHYEHREAYKAETLSNQIQDFVPRYAREDEDNNNDFGAYEF